MKIAVIGANGRTGSIFVKHALAKGHIVKAGVYGRSELISSKNLVVMKCDATNQNDIDKLVQGQEVVVSLIGHVKNSPKDVQTKAITCVIKSMRKFKINRLISLTGTGVRFDGDRITIIDRILNFGVMIFDPNRIKDGINHVNVIKDSDLDWTIIRVLKLQNSTPKRFSLSDNGPTKLYVSREEVADAILEVVESNSHINKAPIISY